MNSVTLFAVRSPRTGSAPLHVFGGVSQMEFLGGLWFVAIGAFLRQTASLSYQQLVVRRARASRRVAEVTTREVVQVTPGLSLSQLADDYFWRHHVTSFPVVDGGRLVGIVSLRDLERVPREAWPATTVREVMRGITGPVTTPGESLWQAFAKVSQNGLGRVAVVEEGRLAGYLSVKDAVHVLAIAGR